MSINYGSTKINDIFYGNKRVLQIYYGSNLVYNVEVGLPKDYIALEYIESNNGQYINTNIPFNSISKAKVDGQFTQYSNLDYPTVLGCSNDNNYGVLVGRGPDGFYEQTGNSSGYIYHTKNADLERHTFITDLENSSMTIDDVVNTFTHDKSLISLNVYLMRRNISDTSLGTNCYFKCYGCKIWNPEGNTITNLVPALRKSDNIAGMYDLKRRKFFSSETDDEFIAGPIV